MIFDTRNNGQAVVRQSSGSRQAVVRQSSGSLEKLERNAFTLISTNSESDCGIRICIRELALKSL